MADYSRSIEIGYGSIRSYIHYNVTVEEDCCRFRGEAYLPNKIDFTYDYYDDERKVFFPDSLVEIKRELIIDAIMTDFEDYKLTLETLN